MSRSATDPATAAFSLVCARYRRPSDRGVADFDGDGWSDLVIVAGAEQEGDDPIYARMAELRLGPFSHTGRGQQIRHLHLRAALDIAVADYDHDRHPDLAVYTYAGDGVHETQARLGNGATGLGTDIRAFTVDDFDTDHSAPADLPHSGLDPFCPPCPTNPTTG